MAIEEHRKEPFGWGVSDCAVLFSDAVFAMTDCDPFEAVGLWKSEMDALRALARMEVRSVYEFIEQRFEQVPVAFARRGDCGFIETYDALTCPAIITGHEAVSRNEKGWVSFPITRLAVAFRVG